jgi:hypothetical protein
MGLDMYAYVASKAKQHDEFYESAVFDKESNEMVNTNVSKPREIAYWRKHPNLHGWMEKLAQDKGLSYDSFNGVEMELTYQDLDELERAVTHKQLPATDGFFFGNPSDEYYYESDLEFIKNARAELFLGLKVFYNSSW